MLFLEKTTLCCVDCLHYDFALRALHKTMQHCQFEQVYFFTDSHFNPPADVDLSGIQIITIPKIQNTVEYSHFMLKKLDAFIQTDFVLVIQWDGYVLHPQSWSETFREYDYIGAKWWYEDGMNVGNGGFSWRSKKLLTALQDPYFVCYDPEDALICRIERPTLEQQYGIRFAPDSLADQFAFECQPPVGLPFGFHGRFNFHFFHEVDDLFLIAEQTHLEQDLKAAAVLYKQILKKNQHYLPAWRGLSAVAAEIGLLPEATQYLYNAHQLDPTNPIILNDLGVLYSHQQNYPHALACFEQALRFDANYVAAQQNYLAIQTLIASPS